MGHQNEQIVHDFFKAFATGDMELLAKVTTDDLTMVEPGTTHVAGVFTGRDAVLEMFAELGRVTEGTLAIDKVHHVLANDEVGVAVFDSSATRHGERITSQVNELYTFRDGKIARIQAFVFDMPEWDRAYRKD